MLALLNKSWMLANRSCTGTPIIGHLNNKALIEARRQPDGTESSTERVLELHVQTTCYSCFLLLDKVGLKGAQFSNCPQNAM